MSIIKILAVGDVVGQEAVSYLDANLGRIKSALGADMTVVNAENAATGNGLDTASARALLGAGADVLTTGNHVYRHASLHSFLEDSAYTVRPVNYPAECPGNGYTVFRAGEVRVLVINALGTTYMEPLACPFETVERVLNREKGSFDVAILDIHAEATSEKAAIARYFDGRISAVFGTHTHVQTADARILPNGTGFITDIGMCGPENSILGVECKAVIDKLRLHMPRRFDVAKGRISATGALFAIDSSTGRALSAEGISF